MVTARPRGCTAFLYDKESDLMAKKNRIFSNDKEYRSTYYNQQVQIERKKEAIQAESVIHRGQKRGDAAHDRYTWIMDQMKKLSDLAKKKLRETSSDDLLEAVDRIADKGGYLNKRQLDMALEDIAQEGLDDLDDVIF